MQKTRWNILGVLKLKGSQTVKELSEELRITSMGVRQHLASLERDGLVQYRTESRGRGRSSHVYSLTISGDECFPRGYEHFANELIEIVQELDDSAGIERLFQRRAERREAVYRTRIRGKTVGERVRELAQLRTEEGFMASCENLGDGTFRLVETNCAIYRVASKCAEACEAELRLFQRVLDGTDVTRDNHIAGGDRRCAYRVQQRGDAEFTEPGITGTSRRRSARSQ